MYFPFKLKKCGVDLYSETLYKLSLRGVFVEFHRNEILKKVVISLNISKYIEVYNDFFLNLSIQ